MSLLNKQIRFPKELYIGRVGRQEDGLALAFLTENGTDAAAVKRKATVDAWVARNSGKFVASDLANEPLVGFRLGRSIKRDSSWGSGNVKWRIEDPRGFELEISSPNMAQIVASAVLEHGEILDQCIWARLGGDNVLVPVSSELYQVAQENSVRISKSVSLKDVRIGNRIKLQNGTEGIYLGRMHEIDSHYTNSYFQHRYSWSSPKSMMLVDGRVQSSSSLKVSEVLDTAEITAPQAEQLAWENNGIISQKKTEIGELKCVLTKPDDLWGKVGYVRTKMGDETVIFPPHKVDPMVFYVVESELVDGMFRFVRDYSPNRHSWDDWRDRDRKKIVVALKDVMWGDEYELLQFAFQTTSGIEVTLPI